LDLVQVLIGLGADIKAVSLADVLLTWDPAVIRFFVDNGADVIAGAPFAVAFAERIPAPLLQVLGWNAVRGALSVGGLLPGGAGPLQGRFLVWLEDRADLA
jgi:hypothetical protein